MNIISSMELVEHYVKFLCLIFYVSSQINGQSSQCKDPVGSNARFNPLKPIEVSQSQISTEYDAKGLQPFFNLAKSFINTVQPKKLSEGFKDFDMDDFFKDENVDQIRKYEIPIAITAGFGILFALLFPIVGLCFCCCRVAGKCGGSMTHHPNKSRNHKCCVFMSFLLFIVTIMMLCGVLLMFVTNNRLHSSYKESGPFYREVVDEAMNFFNATTMELEKIPDDQITCIAKLVKDDVGLYGIKLLVGNKIQDLVRKNLSNVIDRGLIESGNINKIGAGLTNVKDTSEDLKALSDRLNKTLDDINKDIKAAAIECDSLGLEFKPICNKLREMSVTSSIEYDQLPDINDEIDKMNDIIKKNLTGEILKANQILDDIPQTTADKSDSQRKDIIKSIEGMEKEIKKVIEDITKDIKAETLDKRSEYMEYGNDYLDQGNEYAKYEDYRWYGYIGLSAVMLLIVLLLGCGLTSGICGYKKDRTPTQRTGSSNCGGRCLMGAVGFMFLFAFIFMIFCVAWFVAGTHMHIVCRDMQNGEIFDEFISEELSNISISESLKNCRENEALYKATNGEKIFNLTKEFDVRSQAKDFDKELDKINIDLSDQEILTKEAEDALKNIQNTGINSINFTKFFNILERKLTEQNLTVIVDDLTQYSQAAKDRNKDDFAETIDDIKSSIIDLQNSTLVQIEEKVIEIKGLVQTVQDMTYEILPKAKEILDLLQASSSYIKDGLASEIKNIVKNYANRMIGWLEQGTDHLIGQAKTNMAKCRPLANIFDGALNTYACDTVVQNANGFWLALGWCLLFFIPALVFATRLAKYFRRMDYEIGHEDMIEHPPYNDKIPLHHYQMEAPPPYEHRNDGYQYQ